MTNMRDEATNNIYEFLNSLNMVVVLDPTLTVHRHENPVTTDTVSSNNPPAIDTSGETTDPLLLARPKSLVVADLDGMKTQDTIHFCDARINKAVYPIKTTLVVDPSPLTDRLYRHWHLNASLLVGGVVMSQHGNMTADMHRYAYIGRGHVIASIDECGKTISSLGQLELNNNDVIDPSVKVLGDLQAVCQWLDLLLCVSMCPFAEHDLTTLQNLVWTANTDWRPSVLDCTLEDVGNFRKCVIIYHFKIVFLVDAIEDDD
jgi:hypothetical protein